MAQGIYDLLQETLKLTTNLNKQLCCEPTPLPTTTTTTTIFIPPGGEIVTIIIGYQTISPVENIVLSNTLEDLCILVNNSLNNNIVPNSFIFDGTTYYYVSSNNTLYNLVTNSIAQNGYYFISLGGVFQVINGLVVQVILDEAELFEICNLTTPTEAYIDDNKILKLK